MKLARSTFASAAALFVALSLTAAQAEPQPNATPGGAPAAGNIGAGAMAPAEGGRLDQQGGAAGQSGPMGAERTLPSEGNPAKEPQGSAETRDDADMPSGSKAGRQAEDKADGTGAGNQAGSKAGMPEDGKSGATAEDKGDAKAKSGKSVRLESNDVSKIRTHFSANKPNVKRIDRNEVSVSIGIALPTAIVLYDLPPGVIVVGGPCPIKYFVWGDDIVLVDSCSREVVEVIVGVA